MNQLVSSKQTSLAPRNSRRWLLVVLAVYVLLSLAYGFINPLFEAPDEHRHYFAVQAIADSGRLPTTRGGASSLARQETAQPPLYYVISALIILPVDTAGAEEMIWANPHVRLGDASAPININAFVHTPAEDWPWSGPVLAGHLLRIFSTLIGLGTLLFIYGSGRLMWPGRPERALLATALVAFLPQFAFLHASISNDPLIVLLSATALWQLLRMWFQGLRRGRLLLLGLTIGLAILTKMAGLLLLFYAAGFLIVLLLRDGWGRRAWRSAGEIVTLMVIPALLVAGWLLIRNWTLYGDITATNEFVRLAGGDRHYSLFQVLGETDGLWRSFFAVFGWLNVSPPSWIYGLWVSLVTAALIGASLGVSRTIRDQASTDTAQRSSFFGQQWILAALLGIWVLIVYAGLVQFMLRTPAAQGRLLFPALVPLALGAAYGLSQFRRIWVYWLAPLIALVTTLYSLIVVIPAAYAPPPTIALSQLPAEASRLDTDLGQGLELVAASLETDAAEPGEWIWLTLYWRATSVPLTAPQYVVELFGRDTALAGKVQSYHGGGRFPANLWTSEDIIIDRQAVRLFTDMETPAQVRLNVRLVGELFSVEAGTAKVSPPEWPPETDTVLAQIEGVDLTGVGLEPVEVAPGDVVSIDLRWQVRAGPGRNLTTLVHLGDPDQTPLAQADSPPLNGDYPTHWWSPGEVISDTYTLQVPSELPDGRYPIQIGMYDSASGVRLPLTVDGQRQQHDVYSVGWLEVRSP